MNSFVVRIDVDGTPTTAVLDNDTSTSLRRLVGCDLFDVVGLGDVDMWVDDEGMLNGSPVNIVATKIVTELFRQGQHWQDYHGNVVFAASDSEGDTIPLPDETVAILMGTAAALKALYQPTIDRLLGDPE